MYSPQVRTKVQSCSSTKVTPDSSLVGTQSNRNNDDLVKTLQYKTSVKSLNRLPRPSKSETTNKHTTSSQPLSVTVPSRKRVISSPNKVSTTVSTIIKPQLTKSPPPAIQEEEEEDSLSYKLRSTFIDVIDSSSVSTSSIQTDDDMIDMIKSQFDAQSIRIRRLERALKEKDEQLIKGDDDEKVLLLLLTRYPQSMQLYRKQVEKEQFNRQLETCIDQFENQKERMMEEYHRNFELLKMKYRSRFDDIVERMISDPSRLDDEWARRVQKDADDRIEEFKRRVLSQRRPNH
jgi:hypothetical protein